MELGVLNRCRMEEHVLHLPSMAWAASARLRWRMRGLLLQAVEVESGMGTCHGSHTQHSTYKVHPTIDIDSAYAYRLQRMAHRWCRWKGHRPWTH